MENKRIHRSRELGVAWANGYKENMLVGSGFRRWESVWKFVKTKDECRTFCYKSNGMNPWAVGNQNMKSHSTNRNIQGEIRNETKENEINKWMKRKGEKLKRKNEIGMTLGRIGSPSEKEITKYFHWVIHAIKHLIIKRLRWLKHKKRLSIPTGT